MSVGLLVACLQPPRTCEPSGLDEWWANQVVCVTVEAVDSMQDATDRHRYYALAAGQQQHVLKQTKQFLCGPPEHLAGPYLDAKIVAYTEQRQHFWAFQPESWLTYHVSTIFEVERPRYEKLFVLVERIDDKLEISLGVGNLPKSFMLEFRATGKQRKSDRCFQQPRQVVVPRVTLRHFFEWLTRSLSKRWQPYHILHSNCQHVADELQNYVRDPTGTASSVAKEEWQISQSQNQSRSQSFIQSPRIQPQGIQEYSYAASSTPVCSFKGVPAMPTMGAGHPRAGAMRSSSFDVHPQYKGGYAMKPSHVQRPMQRTPDGTDNNCFVQ